MAQVQEERMTWARRCRLYARQRPAVLVIGAVVATLLIMALGAGVTGALGAAGAGDGGGFWSRVRMLGVRSEVRQRSNMTTRLRMTAFLDLRLNRRSQRSS